MLITKKVSMIRKYYNHKLQTNLWNREEEPHNNHETPGRQATSSLFPIEVIAKLEYTKKHRTITKSHNGSNQKRINYRTTTLERTATKATGELKCILLVPNLCPRFCCGRAVA